ncbi:MAG: protease inhibitor I42 family protein [Verrucomicrobiota bacterium]
MSVISRLRQIFLISAVAFPLSGASAIGQTTPTIPRAKISEPSDEVVVDESADGSLQSLLQGDVLVIKLQENPSTGYVWSCSSSRNVLLQLGQKETVRDPASHLTVGKNTTITWRFLANEAGDTALTFTLKRPWESNIAAIKTISVPVTVANPLVVSRQALLQISEKDENKALYIKKGDRLVVKLASNPSTGQSWKAATSKAGVFSFPTQPYFQPDDQTDLIGAGGTTVWFLTATEIGTTSLLFSYSRPNNRPSKIKMWHVTVTD